MAAFDLAPEAGDTDDLPEDGAPAAATPAQDAAPVADQPPTGPGQVVSLEKPESRRARAERERKEEIDRLAKSVESLRDGLSQRDQQLAQMRGFMEAQALQPRYQQPQQQAAPGYVELAKRAKQALDEKKFDEFHELTIAAAEAKTMERLAPVMQELQQRQPANSMPPELGAMFAAYPDVAMHPDNVKLLSMKNAELELRRVPAGPERLRMVFAEADAFVKASKKNGAPAQYSQSSASVLSGMPTSSGSRGGSDGPGITLTAVEAGIAERLERQGVMTKAQYAKGLADADPARVRG